MRCEALTARGTRCLRDGPGVGWIRFDGREVAACDEHWTRVRFRLPVSFTARTRPDHAEPAPSKPGPKGSNPNPAAAALSQEGEG